MSEWHEAIAQIRELGYTRIPQALGRETARNLLVELRRVLSESRAATSGEVPFLNRGHHVVYNLQNKSWPLLRCLLRHSGMREILIELLNDPWYRHIPLDRPNYLLRSFGARSSGSEAMPLHLDSFVPGAGSFPWVMQVALILEPQTVAGGCTLFVPVSHRRDRYAQAGDLAEAVPVESQPGDVLLWDSRIWHGAGANTTGETRWALIATFCRWWIKQNYDLPRGLPADFYARLSDEEKAVLGYCSIPPADEFEHVDIKGGYERLKPSPGDY